MLGLAGVVVIISFHFAQPLGMDDHFTTVPHYLCRLDGHFELSFEGLSILIDDG